MDGEQVREPGTAPSGAARPNSWNRFMERLLTSPLGGLARGHVLVRYTGRRSGLPRQLPVGCEPCEGGWLIRVGRPEQKSWWRNFKTPGPIELVRGRRVIRGTAAVVLGNTESGRRIAAECFRRHGGRARSAGLPKLGKGEAWTDEQIEVAAAPLVFVVVTPHEAAR